MPGRSFRAFVPACLAIGLLAGLALADEPHRVQSISQMTPWPEFEPFGAEDAGAQHNAPRIPEPLVFDLVRPLGARRGELEINTLALIPLRRNAGRNRIPDPIGLVPSNSPVTEWAPEIEYAIFDGVAVEFEVPIEETRLAAYKGAVQVTFGTAFEERFIHGAQGILLYDRETGRYSPTVTYIAGVRFDEHWSLLGMLGLRTEINNDDAAERTERIVNLSLFYDATDHVSLGVESNLASSLSGASSWLIMPQVHWEITDYWMLQFGTGLSFTKDYTLPEIGLRLIRSF
jgi:hypothetical protein